mmetsp:Transcript_22752/g.33600  ORF Transcript_22752/g.33600 Transcript_22752/m.33600 type:complete len:203 (+) Transcript_22752:61-669(+)
MEDEAPRLLFSATLEVLIHQLLYVGNAYPSQSFTKTIFLGIVGRTNRHVSVVDYIRDCVDMATPVLLSDGGGKLIVAIGSERFVLSLRGLNFRPNHDDNNNSSQLLPALEGQMRDLILSTHAMKRRKASNENDDDDDAFQIQLKPNSNSCPELTKGMSEGNWYQSSRLPSELSDQEEIIRPIHDCFSDLCDFSFYSTVYKNT